MLAGFSRLDITPPLGTPLAGTFSERLAEGIVDPIELNSVAFNDGENTAVIIVTDALGIREDYTTKIRNMIAEECGINAEYIMITATHTHSSFRLGTVPSAIKSYVRNAMDDDQYIQHLLRKYVDAAKLAIDDMKEATISYGIEETSEPISFVRRFLMKDGRVQSFPKIEEYGDIERPMSDADNFVRFVRIDRKEAKSIALVNFSTHPCVVVGKKFSPDWSGYARKHVEALIPNVNCVVYTGAEGDTNHINTKIHERQTGIDHAKKMGRLIAEATAKAWEGSTPSKTEKLSSEIRYVQNKTRTEGMETYEEAKQNFDDYYAKKIKAHEQQLAGWRRIINTRIMPIYQQIPVTTMSIGDIVIVGFGGEAFTQYANRARELAPDKFVIAAACANGYQGYLPSKQAFEDGGYESAGSYYTPSLEDEIMDTVADMFKNI